MFYRAKRAMHRAWFDFNGRAILKTPPLVANDGLLTVVSMLPHGEVLMYLFAIKSFCRQLGRVPAIVILNDGSLTSEDQAILLFHVPHARVVSIRSVDTGSCPKGSCWERLLLINDVSATSYVVQLDSDTLTLSPIGEVDQNIAANHSFTLLGDMSYPEIESMDSACARSKASNDPQIQSVCERSFDQLPESASLRYVRGNAGFAGFAKGSLSKEAIEHFSELMRRISGDQWQQWGSEQVTSNLLVANTEGAVPLPFPKYLSYWAHKDVAYDDAAFIHFIGPYRYANGFYRDEIRKILRTFEQANT